MARNKVQFQKGVSLSEFIKHYGTEEQCFNALFAWRWPNGFQCPPLWLRQELPDDPPSAR